MSILAGRQSVLFVHAHPDNETIATGALFVELVARGIAVSLLISTRSERGDVVPGALSILHDPDELVRERERELRCAA